MNMEVSNFSVLTGHLSSEWLDGDLSCYLERCQVDTPPPLVAKLWAEIEARRANIRSVVDFGAGDGRFAQAGNYETYLGFEIDGARFAKVQLPPNARIVHGCAFSHPNEKASLAIGNPPFVRNQDLPDGWRERVASRLEARSGIRLSGYANAWQYFFLLSLISVEDDGLCALIVPYEWVSRPSAKALREYIAKAGWSVAVYRLNDATFGGVLTTASITIIDKAAVGGGWRYFEETAEGWDQLASASGDTRGHLPYRAVPRGAQMLRAQRGLSPGNQKIFVLTEGERARLGLRPERDVVRCVTTLRNLPADVIDLDVDAFDRFFRFAGQKCWLLNPSEPMSDYLSGYLASVDPKEYATATCQERANWWQFPMPATPGAFIATCFKGQRPKFCANTVGAKAVGGVAGIDGPTDEIVALSEIIPEWNLTEQIVAHANGLFKLEINQLNALLNN